MNTHKTVFKPAAGRPRLLRISALLSLLWAGLMPAAEQKAAVTNAYDFPAFRIIYERNIFNPNRRPMIRGGPQIDNVRPPRVESFSLVGTMIYDEGSYAFFDGSDRRYQTVLKPADTIAGYKVTDISPNCVRLNSASNSIELFMNIPMERREGGEWQLLARAEAMRTASRGAEAETKEKPSTGGSTSTVGAGSDAGADDVIQRLMKKRAQE